MGLSIGHPDDKVDEVSEIAGAPLWFIKFTAWKSLVMKGCPTKGGPGGAFCLWGGHSCYYNACPRRIFEEAQVVESPLPPPPTSENFRKKVIRMDQDVEALKQNYKLLPQIMEDIQLIKKELGLVS